MSKKRIFFYLSVGLVIILTDQITKWLAVKYIRGGFFIVSKLLKIEIYKNRGIAFGFSIPYFILYILVVLVLVFCFLELRKGFIKKNFSVVLALTLVFSGAIGNLIDRLYLGYVIDILHFVPWGSMFNLADLAILVGVGMVIWENVKPKMEKRKR